MAARLIHISDIHYRKGWEENHGAVLHALVDDIDALMKEAKEDVFYVIVSGDIVQAADDRASYDEFLAKFGGALDRLGVSKGHRLCVPGNHDVSQSRVAASATDHEGVVCQNLDETALNEYLQSCNSVFNDKFDAYRTFEAQFSAHPGIASATAGGGFALNEQIGVYCLNSALFSSAGVNDPKGHPIPDKQRLAVGTRALHSWLRECPCPCKVLVSHHPLDWLADWASRELRSLLHSGSFAIFLSGHAHDQAAYHLVTDGKPFVQLHAPPLFTKKSEELGYAVISVCPTRHRALDVTYRQWTKFQRFLPGVGLSGTEDGVLPILADASTTRRGVAHAFDPVDRYLSTELEEALKAFSSQPRVWVDPVISEKAETDTAAKEAAQHNVSTIVASPTSTVIQAPPQFGLSCLARNLCQQAWRASPAARWVCIDTWQVKPTQNSVLRAVETDLKRTGQELADVRCIILDSWRASDKQAVRILKTLCDTFSEIPIFVMQTMDDQTPISPVDDEAVGRGFRVLHLWSLSRQHVRAVVASYNQERHLGDEDIVTARVISDIDTLNMYRTPLNCLTVLKASEADFDENPVNRTEVLHRVLFILFSVDTVPRYKARPDMKDCEHALGYFVETLIRDERYTFTRDDFLSKVRGFCIDQVISVNADVLFDILYDAHIVVPFGSEYGFKFTSWLYYFAAHRMHHDSAFSEFILSEMRYSRFPEIVEFYTGIDRQREDAVRVLASDLRHGVAVVHERCGLPRELNPLQLLQWQASPETMDKMQAELRDGVAESNLPSVIKDRYADKDYNRSRPYCQSVRDVLTGHSMISLMLSVSAAARALRNSDYVDPAAREELLDAIMEGWRQISQVLFVLLPPLAERGHASFDGAWFVLTGDFADNPAERFTQILMAIPFNVVRWYQDDLFSPKMSPLLAKSLEHEKDDLIRHEKILLLIAKRPDGWRDRVQRYIHTSHKRSFYLSDVYKKLREQYRYAFADAREIKDLEYLIKMVNTKHVHGVKRPRVKAVGKVPDSVLPERPYPDSEGIGQ